MTHHRSVLLVGRPEIPIVEIAGSDTEIGSKAKPAKVWGEEPAAGRVNLTPDVGEAGHGTSQGQDIEAGGDGPAQAKVEGCPQEIQPKLDGVERGPVLSKRNGVGVRRGHARGVRTIGSVAHGRIQRRPYWAKDVARGV